MRLSTLPVKYAVKDYLNALWALEMDEFNKSGGGVGLFYRIMTLLSLSLRIDIEVDDVINGRNMRKVGNDFEIDHFVVQQNGISVEITPLVFSSQIRPLLAEQNGLELPNESENAELVQAQEELEEIKSSGKKLKITNDSLIASVAYNSGIREQEIDDWTVREFENRRKAIERDKRYMLHGQAEMSGMVSFKNGNPYPSWCFDTLDDSMGTMALSKLGDTLNGVEQK